ncbi:hypothetical protein SESBI_13577 [Sesbania bispinosa]|nr:hypothetical protein SESBI_13577 [Sesbania bispinosa]
MFTPTEIEVAEILVNFPTQVLELERKRGFPFTWGRKKKRSAISVTPSTSLSLPLPPLKPEASSSPATPLSFSPSESDDNPTLARRNVSLKRKREHYLKRVEELTKDNELLKGEIKNVKCYYDRLKDFNLKLKARKQELSLGPNQVQKQVELQSPGAVQDVPLMVNQTAGPPQMSEGEEGVTEACGRGTTSLGAPSSSGSANSNSNGGYDVGPIGIPDLNIPLEESESYESLDGNGNVINKELSRAIAAQARQNRLLIYSRNNRSPYKPRWAMITVHDRGSMRENGKPRVPQSPQ